MLAAFLLGAIALAVAVLVAVDVSRVKSVSTHEHADGSAHYARREVIGAARGARTEAFVQEPAETQTPAVEHDVVPTRRPESVSPSSGSHQDSAGRQRSGRGLKNWHVRSRLLLLVIIPIVTVTAVALCVVGIASALHGTPTHSALASALTVGIILIVVLASWFTIVIARSVLQPLQRLQAGAQEVAGIRLSDAIRRTGEGVPSDLAPIDVDSSDEIGEVARAFDQMRREVLRLTANEGALRGRLDAMFVNLSHRSQSLVERQIRLIENLEQGEQDTERLVKLSKMDRIASRMHRTSQNLLILAGQEPSIAWNQPATLVNVIRAALAEIEENERVLLSAQPDVAVRGPAVNDVAHLLAELAENATSFSSADMSVGISGHLLTSGGVLVDITDRGIGMAEKDMAYANWQLEHPSAADLNAPRWMGLFVVARLAARHGIRVRLHPAEFGGLTALVWLPDEVLNRQGVAGSPRLTGFNNVGSAPRSPEAAMDSAYATAEPSTTMARPMEFAPSQENVRDAPLGRWLISDAGRPPGSISPPSGQRPVGQAEPPESVRLSDSGLPDTKREIVEVIVPPADGLSGASRLPIFDEVESLWFSRGGRKAFGSSGPSAASGGSWSSPADEGWRAAETVDSPSSSGATAAGLPRRLPNANLIPGAIPSPQPPAPSRSAAAARDRLAGFQRGVRKGRAASSQAADLGGEGEDERGDAREVPS
jgi:signal transduction histidine kinase